MEACKLEKYFFKFECQQTVMILLNTYRTNGYADSRFSVCFSIL